MVFLYVGLSSLDNYKGFLGRLVWVLYGFSFCFSRVS